MQFSCPQCLKKYHVPETAAVSDAGTLIYCPACEERFIAFPDGLTMLLSGSGNGSSQVSGDLYDIAEVPFHLNSGDTLQAGRFEVRDDLGRGSLGSVYRVFDKKSNMDLALKVIVAPEGLETDIFNRIAERMKATEAIKNPGFVWTTYLPLTEDHKGLSLVLLPMAISREGSLRSWMDKNTEIKMRKSKSLALFQEICLAVQSIHDSGVVHLNLKPENIFLVHGSVKIADFNPFRNLHERRSMKWPTAGPRGGEDRHAYMAPEQITSIHPKDVDHRTDIYAMGCILYELLEGNLPGSLNPKESRVGAKPRLRNADGALADVVWKCLEMDSSDRFQAVTEILKSIQAPQEKEEAPESDDKRERVFETVCELYQAYKNAAGVTGKFFHNIVRREPEALNILKEKALQEHPQALYMLGVLFYHGDCVDQDRVEALRLWKCSAGREHGPAQYAVACCYDQGDGCVQDKKEAATWYRKAAEQNIVEAQKDMGDCYYYGEGVPEDKLEAVEWYHRAAKNGNDVAQCNLAYCYQKGIGVPENRSEAIRWLHRSADQGNQTARRLLESLGRFQMLHKIVKSFTSNRTMTGRRVEHQQLPFFHRSCGS